MKTKLLILIMSAILTSCQFSKSVKKDFKSGVSSTGNFISCEDVYLTVNGEKTQRSSFTYGETFTFNFSDVTGFTIENGNVFPGMIMNVINVSGDTIMQTGDLISGYPEGMNFSPLLLTADLTVASPIKSGGKYTAIINIRDRKGDGTFNSKFDFTVKKSDRIAIEPLKVEFDEIYVYSQGKDKVITDNRINFNENVYIIIEGLKGFTETNGMVFPGLSIKASDAAGNIVLESGDLFTQYNASGIASPDLAERVSAHFSVPGSQFNNPLHCEMTVWDKKSDSKIRTVTDLTLE